ncbi:MAG TPA: hypothetical protein VL098_02085 [Flavipsychrobacter sp.]|nr:hypothetical protein [Flavipsychrobacter sp.]
MLKILLAICIPAIVFTSSCKPSKEKMLIGKWTATKMESPQLEQQIKDTKAFIDTVGTSTTPDQNFELYGVRNMDSLRDFMKQQLDATLDDQKKMIDKTWIEFMDKGVVATSFGAPVADTISFYIEEDTVLVLDEMKMKGTGSKINMNIVNLDQQNLTLRFTENGYNSTVIFMKSK